ncbi:MAG: FliH/SctL family protein [Actinomycetota bacterium]
MSTDSDVLIRGDAAAQAVPVDLIHRPPSAGAATPVGPWAERLSESQAQAREEGWQEGRRLGLHEARVESQRQAEALAVHVDRVLERVQSSLDEMEESLVTKAVEVALEVAALILDREVAAATEPGLDAIRRCLAIAPDATDLVARVHPDDAAQLGEVMAVAGRQVTVVADPGLAVGDAVVQADDSVIDGRMSESLRRVAEVLA